MGNNIEVIEKPQMENEPKVIFNSESDLTSFKIMSETDKTMVEILGYGLEINFNMEYINSIEDVEAAVSGIGDLFRRIIMEKLISNKQQ